jgi:hypothetical protein
VTLALLLFLWMWDRVTTSCNGGPETTAYYYFQATMRQNVEGWCEDEFGQVYECSSMAVMPPIRFTADIPDPGVGTTVTTTYDPVADPAGLLPVPPVGGLASWPWFSPESQPVVAVDSAENTSKDCP